MKHYTGRLSELQLEAYKNASALLRLPASRLPRPGQYLQANQVGNTDETLPISLFRAGLEPPHPHGDLVEISIHAPLPEHWLVGTQLALRGPLGQGFQLPNPLKRLALAALTGHPARLLPLIPQALEMGAEVALFCDHEPAGLPPRVELHPLKALSAATAWADFVALDLTAAQVEELPRYLGTERIPKRLRGQALVHAPMPCGGLAGCGVCVIRVARKEKLVCEVGPVLKLSELA